MPLNHFLRDQRGAVMVEVAILLSLTAGVGAGRDRLFIAVLPVECCGQGGADWGQTCRGLGPCGVGP